MTEFVTVVADPPWKYGTKDANCIPQSNWQTASSGPGSDKRYGSMEISELLALRPPVAKNAHLYLWTTNAFTYEAHDIARAWGFKPKTILTWVKTKHEDGSVSMKTGYYFRGATEHALFCVRGSLPLTTKVAYPTAFLWPRLPHSVKPDAFYDLVEMVSPGPYLEMFSRRARLGWETWGNQALHGTDFVTSEVAA